MHDENAKKSKKIFQKRFLHPQTKSTMSSKVENEGKSGDWSVDLQKAKRTFNFKALVKALKESEKNHARFETV